MLITFGVLTGVVAVLACLLVRWDMIQLKDL
jgi:hypothetical protein